MLDFLIDLIPANYRWQIAIKKIAWLIGKMGTGYLTGLAVAKGSLTPEQAAGIQLAVTGLTASGLEAIHDWAKLKWPDKKWL